MILLVGVFYKELLRVVGSYLRYDIGIFGAFCFCPPNLLYEAWAQRGCVEGHAQLAVGRYSSRFFRGVKLGRILDSSRALSAQSKGRYKPLGYGTKLARRLVNESTIHTSTSALEEESRAQGSRDQSLSHPCANQYAIKADTRRLAGWSQIPGIQPLRERERFSHT